jgi:hypothetical protein
LWCLALAVALSPIDADKVQQQVVAILNVLTRVLDASRGDAEGRDPGSTGPESPPLTIIRKEIAIFVCVAAFFAGSMPGADSRAEDLRQLIRHALQSARISTANLNLETGVSNNALLSRLIHNLELIHVVWENLGLSQLSSFARLRSAHLRLITAEGSRDPGRIRKEVERSLGAELRAGGEREFMAHAVLAQSANIGPLSTAGRSDLSNPEIAAHQLLAGIEPAIRALTTPGGADESEHRLRFRGNLLSELGLALVANANLFERLKLDTVIAYLLSTDEKGKGRLASFLDRIRDPSVPEVALWLLNAVGHVDRPDLFPKVKAELLDRSSPPRGSDELHDEIEDLLRLSALASKVDTHQPVDIDEQLLQWKDHKTSLSYPQLLYVLMHVKNSSHDALKEEAVRVVTTAPLEVSTSSWVYLAYMLARLLNAQGATTGADAGTLKASIALMKRLLPDWENSLSAETNIAMRMFLIGVDEPDRDQHIADLARWQLKQLEIAEQEKLPDLWSRGAFFELCWHYYETLNTWDLHMDIPPTEMAQQLGLDERARKKVVQDWREKGSPAVDLFVGEAGQRRLNARFLILGRYLFDGLGDSAEQKRHNTFAENGLGELYRELGNLPTIPDEIRAVVQRHRERFKIPTALP